MPIVAVSMSDSEIEELNALQENGGFSNRSEAVRNAIQSLLAEQRTLETHTGEITVIVTVIYSKRGKSTECHHIQHEFSDILSAMVHSHTPDGGCIDVMIVSGDSYKIRQFIKTLRSQRNVTRIQAYAVGG